MAGRWSSRPLIRGLPYSYQELTFKRLLKRPGHHGGKEGWKKVKNSLYIFALQSFSGYLTINIIVTWTTLHVLVPTTTYSYLSPSTTTISAAFPVSINWHFVTRVNAKTVNNPTRHSNSSSDDHWPMGRTGRQTDMGQWHNAVNPVNHRKFNLFCPILCLALLDIYAEFVN